MIRLLVTLNLMLVLVLGGYMLTVNNTLDFLLQKPQQDYYQRIGQGTFQLLNEAVAGLTPQQRGHKVRELQQHFVYPLQLKQLATLTLSEHKRQRLQQGLISHQEVDNVDFLYGMLAGSDEWVWEAALDLSREGDEINTAAGTFYLLQQQLQAHPPSQWPDIISRLQQQFGFPLVLHQTAKFPATTLLTAAQQQQLDQGRIIAILHDEYSETLYQRVADSDLILQAGIFESPAIARYLNPLVFSVLAGILVTASFFWLWPVWRDLMQIKTAAEQFGNGNYAARVVQRKHSGMSVVTAAFNAMAARTQHSIRAQQELTSAVSHELRTPVARMQFSLDMLSDSADPADRRRYIKNMQQDISELDELLQELLSYARIDQSKRPLQMQQQLLIPWLNETLKNLLPLARNKTLHWSTERIDVAESAVFEPLLMRRVVNNLVQNALRYAQQQVEVTLCKDNDNYILSVSDDGPGIPVAEREHLFEVFATLDKSRNRASDGYGLGLAIVRRIVSKHQGSVSISDSYWGGAKLSASWPTQLQKTP